MLSFGVLIAFLSPKQSEIEESSLESMEKQWKVRNMKNRSFEVLCHKQIRNARSVGSSLKNATWISLTCVDALCPNDPHSCQVDARFQPRLSYGSVFPAKDVWTGRPNTPSEGGGTWAVAGCRNDIARLAHFSQ